MKVSLLQLEMQAKLSFFEELLRHQLLYFLVVLLNLFLHVLGDLNRYFRHRGRIKILLIMQQLDRPPNHILEVSHAATALCLRSRRHWGFLFWYVNLLLLFAVILQTGNQGISAVIRKRHAFIKFLGRLLNNIKRFVVLGGKILWNLNLQLSFQCRLNLAKR